MPRHPKLTYQPTVDDIRPNGHKDVDTLLALADYQPDTPAAALATQIRQLATQLQTEIALSSRERDIRDNITSLQTEIEKLVAQLQQLRQPSNPEPADTLADIPVRTIRDWGKSQGLKVPDRGRFLPQPILDAYRKAHR